MIALAKLKKLVYVAHPFGGNEKNKTVCENLIKKLTRLHGEDSVFISPVLNFGHSYSEFSYADGVDICLDLLRRCDCLLLCGDWTTSKGCMAEYAFAKAIEMPIQHIAEFDL